MIRTRILRQALWPILTLGLVLAASAFAAEPDARLADAAEAQDWDRVAALAREGAGNQAAQPDGMTALHWAVYHNHEPTVRLLIEAKQNVQAVTRYGITPLSIACTLGNPGVVKQLLDAGAKVERKLPGGESPLMLAARTGNAEVLRHLLAHQAPVNVSDRSGQTALMWAAAAGHVEAVDVLLKAGADVKAATKNDFTAIMFAAREGRMDVVRRLLKAGVDVNAVMRPKSSGGRTPRKGTSALILAVESGHYELAMLLIEEGADPNDQRSGYAPLHVLSWVRKPNRGEDPSGDPPPRGSGHLTDLEFVEALVKAGADVNLQLKRGQGGRAVLNPRGATPFLLASKTADVPYLKLLLKLGADPKLTNVDGCTPLMAAAGVGVRAVGEEAGTEPEVVAALKLLIGLGLDVNAVDQNKETAMHGAAYRNFPLAVALLAEHGADPKVWNHKNKYGWTPFLIAQGHRPGSFKPSPETVRALEAARSPSD